MRRSSTKPGTGNSDADDWEKAEMAKIVERYEDLNATILDWENKKKREAKYKIEKLEGELERRRAKAMQHYHTKMDLIDQVANKARAEAEKTRRNEEIQAKEKAEKIRTTGKSPTTCFCL